MTARGGPQRIPRPAGVEPGSPAPWAELPPAARAVTLDDVRRAFAGRTAGRPSVAEFDARRASAVLAPLYEHEGEPYLLFTRRSWQLRAHQGEVSFPGGAADPGETPTQAALREAEEEVGLDPASVEVLGELDHLTTVSSRSFIVPLVGVLPARPERLTPNPVEVEAVLHVPVAELLREDVYRAERWPWFEGGTREIHFFELVGDTIWGATASMLRQLLGWSLGLDVPLDHP